MITLYFVEHIPERVDLQPDTLYISEMFAMTIHLCPCCGDEIAAPIDAETGWEFTVTDGLVTATPSFENRRCKTHYVITNGEFVFC